MCKNIAVIEDKKVSKLINIKKMVTAKKTIVTRKMLNNSGLNKLLYLN
jgi:hypothetical protein